MTLAVFLVALGASLRLTRLAIDDSILEPLHARILRLSSSDRYKRGILGTWLFKLFSCPWCIGFWISLGVTLLAAASNGGAWFFYPAAALSISWLVGILHTAMYVLEGE